ncbi:MAG: hypothetical protein JNJ73_14885 [Hyphomonadaceae bacterium]|nr:hypothetical protein [Hyphomonadaceae bacterium]
MNLQIPLMAVLAAGFLSAGGVAAAKEQPRPQWAALGQSCIASRKPPGRRSRIIPPRVCAVTPPPAPQAPR